MTTVRPTKKQRELLGFIEQFIGQHGYSPSYREIMNGLNYTSVATVALHVNNLIARGHLRKRDHSARSLEIVRAAVTEPEPVPTMPETSQPSQEKWLVGRVERLFAQAEQDTELQPEDVERLQALIATLKLLEFEGAAASFTPRLSALKQRLPQVG